MNTPDNSIRVLVVDDHPLFRQGIATILSGQADMTVVAEASNGGEAHNSFVRTVRTLR
jgi:DNA-binding NarL/FixJ family response regulator